MKNKKGVMSEIVSVFVLVLVISILAGLTFLFVTQLKDNVFDSSARETVTVVNETGLSINGTGSYLATINVLGFASPTAVLAINGSSGATISADNYTLSSAGRLINTTANNWNKVNLTYTYSRIKNTNAYESVNDTEASGATVVNYLPLIFLALIFGAILTLVLKIILPYINLGNQFGGEY